MSSNSTWVITLLHIGGVILFIVGGFILLNALHSREGAYGILAVAGCIATAIPFFFFAQVLQNLQEQTELLKEIRLNTSRIKNPEETISDLEQD